MRSIHAHTSCVPGLTLNCSGPWTAAHDQKLRVLVEKYKVGGQVNWQTVALKANFGHNSGSCQKRFDQLPKLKWQDANVFIFESGAVIAKKKEWQ